MQGHRCHRSLGVLLTSVLAGVALATGSYAFGTGAASASTPTQVWGTPTAIPGTPGVYGYFISVSCSDATDCTAVGEDGNDEPMYVKESGGTWGAPKEIADSLTPDSYGSLYSVSCTDTTDCTAVGYDWDSFLGTDEPIYVTESGGTWGAATELLGFPGRGGWLEGVSCSVATDCTAVGGDENGDGQSIYVTESSGTWGTPTEIPGAPRGGGSLYGIDCTDAGDCTAVGSGWAGSNEQPFYATESGGIWGTTVTDILYSPNNGGYLYGVSCTDATDCTAVGEEEQHQPMYATESGGSWGTPTDLQGVLGGGGYLSSVSCTDATDCTAVGEDHNDQPVYATESGGTWSAVTEIPGSPAELGWLGGVSCPSAGDCTAVGNDGSGQPMYVDSNIPQVPDTDWRKPSPIVYGTPLGTRQLDARASVAGKFVYSPALGAILTPSTYTLSATFYPTDSFHYATTTVTTMLVVKPARTITTLSFTSPVVRGSENNVDFVVTVKSSIAITATGTYEVKVGSHLVCDASLNAAGVGTCTLGASQLGTGTYRVRAMFLKNSDFTGSTSAVGSLWVQSST